MSRRRFTFGLGGFVLFCALLAVVAGLVGRWWLRQFLPKVTIHDAVALEDEPISFSIVLSEPCESRVAVRLATRDGTAAGGRDYVPVAPMMLIFEPGETTKYVEVEANPDDEEGEEDETVFLELLGAVGAVIERQQAVGTIGDAPPPPDVAITRFYGDGTELKIDYTVTSELWGDLKFEVLAYYDDYGGPTLASGVGSSSRGAHTLTISPAFDDFQRDYFLLAAVDSGGYIESNEENNFARFAGGAFIVREPNSGKTVLHVHGSERGDATSYFPSAAIDEVHFRGHGGEDQFDLHAFLPGKVGWLFGGQGNDTLVGSSADDVIFGGPGDDILRGAGGDDLLAGCSGRDKLYGECGKDELYGGPDNDLLLDADESTRFDGGPGRDSFNGSHRNPSLPSVSAGLRDHYRDVEDERELCIDLLSGTDESIKSLPDRKWNIECDGSAIAGWLVNGDTLQIEFHPGVPEVSLVKVRADPRAAEQAASGESAHAKFRIYSISITGYTIERKTGRAEDDWVEERGDLWSSDTLRWTATYEPKDVSPQWRVEWLCKPFEDVDHPRVDWQVFAKGERPIANPPTSVHAITPRFVFDDDPSKPAESR